MPPRRGDGASAPLQALRRSRDAADLPYSLLHPATSPPGSGGAGPSSLARQPRSRDTSVHRRAGSVQGSGRCNPISSWRASRVCSLGRPSPSSAGCCAGSRGADIRGGRPAAVGRLGDAGGGRAVRARGVLARADGGVFLASPPFGLERAKEEIALIIAGGRVRTAADSFQTHSTHPEDADGDAPALPCFLATNYSLCRFVE